MLIKILEDLSLLHVFYIHNENIQKSFEYNVLYVDTV